MPLSNHSHRRRSHSASSPIPRRHPDDVKWRISAKRSRPSSIRSPSYKDLAHDQPLEKWDVDQWRRGKRARRDFNPEESSDEFGSSIPSSDPVLPAEQPHASGFPSTSRLPCTSAAFQFFPQKKKQQQARRLPKSGPVRARSSPRESGQISSDEARRMRASALGELHRSVAESGEGLVLRMRDWECTHLRSPRLEGYGPSSLERSFDAPRREWRRPTSRHGILQGAPAAASQLEDDEDDIFIVTEKSSLPITSCSPALKKRALSLSMMDVDPPAVEAHTSPFAGLGDSHRSLSPVDRSSELSACSSDDEGHMDTDLSSSGIFSTPALSHTYSVSTNSSLVSLPLSLLATESSNAMVTVSTSSITVVPESSTPPPTCTPSTASRSEKAIAALTLAIANGAAGISDYEALRMTEGLNTLDGSHAGELWS